MHAVRLIRACMLSPRIGGDAGTVLLVEDSEARDLVENLCLAVYAPEYDPAPNSVVPELVCEEEAPAPRPTSRDVTDVPLPDDDEPWWRPGPIRDETGAPGTAQDMRRPWTTHSKADWIAWAVHNGADPDVAAQMSKVDLMSRYGERL